jgi:hypothetical protein
LQGGRRRSRSAPITKRSVSTGADS